MTDLPDTDALNRPDRLWCWNFQTDAGAWSKGWGGYARPENRRPLDDRERATGAEYVRADIHDGLAARVIEQDAALAAKDARIAVLEEALIRISIEAKGTGIPNESLHVVRTVAIAALEDGQ